MQSHAVHPFGGGASGLSTRFRPTAGVTEVRGKHHPVRHNILPPSEANKRAAESKARSAGAVEEEDSEHEGYASRRRSEETRQTDAEQAMLDQMCQPKLFIPFEVRKGQRTRDQHAAYLMESYAKVSIAEQLLQRGLDFDREVRRAAPSSSLAPPARSLRIRPSK